MRDKKVAVVTFRGSEVSVKRLQPGEKIVAEMFGGYVVKHYFCIRIRERTQVFKWWNKKLLEKVPIKFGS